MGETFREKFCRYYGVPWDRYDDTVLRLTLYPHARWLRMFGEVELLVPDRAFIGEVGRLTRWRDFAAAVWGYQGDPMNRGFCRNGLRLRVSVLRMRVLFSEVWGCAVPADATRSAAEESPRDPSTFLTD